MKKHSIFTCIRRTFTVMAVGVLLPATGVAFAADSLAWDKTFPQSDKVNHEKVSFNNRLGIHLVGDLYTPKTIDRSKKSPAIGGVKEQTSGLYAQQMAERGFVTLAFDASYDGESGGQPRSIASPEAFIDSSPSRISPLGCPEEYDPVHHLPRDCSRIKIIIGLRDRVVPRTDIEELASLAESRGAEVLEQPEFAHPFQDLSLEIHRRRFQAVADFLTRWQL